MLPERITTDRLELRPPVAADAVRIAELAGNWQVVSRLAQAPYPYTLADAHRFLGNVAERRDDTEFNVYAIARCGELMGVLSITAEAHGPTLGYWLGEPHWGAGIMTEAAGAVIEQFLNAQPDATLASGVFKDNRASLAVQRKLGFEIVGDSEIMCVARGEKVMQFDTELNRARFEKARS